MRIKSLLTLRTPVLYSLFKHEAQPGGSKSIFKEFIQLQQSAYHC